jgi:hypothetical protein
LVSQKIAAIWSMPSSSFCPRQGRSSAWRRCRRLLDGVVDQHVQVGVLLEVLGLEVVVPQHREVVLGQRGAVVDDLECAGPEDRVLVGQELLLHGLDGLRLDAGLGGVVDAAGQVAVGRDDGPRGQDGEQAHVILSSA